MVGVIGNAYRIENRFTIQMVGERNLRAVAEVTGALPLMFAASPDITDVGYLGRGRKHQRQGTRHFGHRAKISLADHLHRKPIFDAIGISYHADNRPPHHLASSPTQCSLRSCIAPGGGSISYSLLFRHADLHHVRGPKFSPPGAPRLIRGAFG